jgi:glycerol-3-phosphate acyltransferase PlsX
VLVSDGYTGNIGLKSAEGCGKAIGNILKREFKRNFFTKLRALLVKDIIGKVRSSMDYERVGGAMFLGLSKIVLKAHGNSKAKTIKQGVLQAANAVRGDMLGKMSKMLEEADMSVKPAGGEA